MERYYVNVSADTLSKWIAKIEAGGFKAYSSEINELEYIDASMQYDQQLSSVFSGNFELTDQNKEWVGKPEAIVQYYIVSTTGEKTVYHVYYNISTGVGVITVVH